MIVKVQLSVASSDGTRRVVVYNKDRSVYYEQSADADMVALFDALPAPKFYCTAQVRGGLMELFPEDRQPEQEW